MTRRVEIESPAFTGSILNNYASASSREWLETNGLGGYSSSTLSGAHTRGYHGLLVVATQPPTVRHVLLSRLDETVTIGDTSTELSTRAYQEAVTPSGHTRLAYYNQEHNPIFTYEVNGACITKSVLMITGTNTVIVTYELMLTERVNEKVTLRLRPFFAYRGYHERRSFKGGALGTTTFQEQTLRFRTDTGLPDTYITCPRASWSSEPDWYYQFHLSVEEARGLPAREDLFTAGELSVTLTIGSPIHVVISTESKTACPPAELIERELSRRTTLLEGISGKDRFSDILAKAADQFIVRRGDAGRTIIAGYPWFTDWGRDTMIALPGCCLVTKRFADAKAILSAFLEYLHEGLIPNRFPDVGEEPEYNTVDGTLWFFVAAWQYLKYSRDLEFAEAHLLASFLEIISWHERGTRFDIEVDKDSLLSAGTVNTQLTWMDARVNGTPVTPRHGKAVEINALWYNALRITAALCKILKKEKEAGELNTRAATVKSAFFEVFWSEVDGYLIDCVNETGRDSNLRPNQLLALSLPFPLLETKQAQSVLSHVTQKLLTPRGMRTLSPEAPAYRGHYSGDSFWRDSSYHQGTVWPWLLGPYLTAVARFENNGALKVTDYLQKFSEHLNEAGVGTVSEIFDGDHPWIPHGCFAQAWSVAEILRVYLEDVKGIYPPEF